MNAQRNDHRDDMSAPHDAVANLVRATNEAMEAFMKTDWTKDSEGQEGVALNPLMANPAIMMAAATAYGIRMTGQWASLFLNAMQDQADRAKEQPAEADVAETPVAAEAEVVEPEQVVEPVAAEAQAAVEPATAKAVELEAAKPLVMELPQSEPLPAKVSADETIGKRARKAAKVAKVRKSVEKATVAKAPVSAGDDLKRISGIGPKLANVLTGHGVVTFAQLADMDEAALAALDAELGLEGRILRDDWAGQARKILATGH
ncbi:NADH-quinone oxidoreductase subunit E [Rhizobium aquaticum]|uniref:NADH-quinone oxidoreductase subunit E n=1 Tax=Rhizobium aquaticum TaxID=1549636 RepID=A0ABV2IWG1_9HYPH